MDIDMEIIEANVAAADLILEFSIDGSPAIEISAADICDFFEDLEDSNSAILIKDDSFIKVFNPRSYWIRSRKPYSDLSSHERLAIGRIEAAWMIATDQ